MKLLELTNKAGQLVEFHRINTAFQPIFVSVRGCFGANFFNRFDALFNFSRFFPFSFRAVSVLSFHKQKRWMFLLNLISGECISPQSGHFGEFHPLLFETVTNVRHRLAYFLSLFLAHLNLMVCDVYQSKPSAHRLNMDWFVPLFFGRFAFDVVAIIKKLVTGRGEKFFAPTHFHRFTKKTIITQCTAATLPASLF